MNSNSGIAGAHMARVNADILRVLTLAITQKTENSELNSIEILRVETSSNLDNAKVFVSGGVAELEKASGFLKNEIAKSLNLRRVPVLRFIEDKGQKNADRVEELLSQIRRNNEV